MSTKRQSTPFPNTSACNRCGVADKRISQCEGGYVCEDCAAQVRQGRDNTTRAVRTQQRFVRGQATKQLVLASDEVPSEQLEYEIAASEFLAGDAMKNSSAAITVNCGEVASTQDGFLRDTLATPGMAALDASADRLDLISGIGVEIAALALDASDTIQAGNSLEKMLAHQLAALHHVSMRYMGKAAMEQDRIHEVRMMNLSIRSMETFQKGLMTLKSLRSKGEQRITVQHVSVNDGGQAVISQGQPGGMGLKP